MESGAGCVLLSSGAVFQIAVSVSWERRSA